MRCHRRPHPCLPAFCHTVDVRQQHRNIRGCQHLAVVQLIQADQRLLCGALRVLLHGSSFLFRFHAHTLEQAMCQIIASRKPASNQQSVKSATGKHCRIAWKSCNDPCKSAMQIDDLRRGISGRNRRFDGGRSESIIVALSDRTQSGTRVAL
jgi:hypothetical protein